MGGFIKPPLGVQADWWTGGEATCLGHIILFVSLFFFQNTQSERGSWDVVDGSLALPNTSEKDKEEGPVTSH